MIAEKQATYRIPQYLNFDKIGCSVYDVSIMSEEASNMINLQKWVEQYLTACKYQKGLDAKTIKAYGIDLSQFILFVGQGATDLTRSSMMEYISDLHQKYKPRTIRRKIASVKAFSWSAGHSSAVVCPICPKLQWNKGSFVPGVWPPHSDMRVIFTSSSLTKSRGVVVELPTLFMGGTV